MAFHQKGFASTKLWNKIKTAKSFCLFVLVFRIQPSHYFVESVQKE